MADTSGSPATTTAPPSPRLSRRASRRTWVPAAYLALTSVLVGWAASSSAGGPLRAQVLAVLAGSAVVATVLASARIRRRRSLSLAPSQRDPFAALALSVVVLAAPHVLDALGLALPEAVSRHVGWVTTAAGAALGLVVFATLICDLAPGRALDTVYVAAIAAMAVGLSSWTAVVHLGPREPVTTLGALQVLVPAVVCLTAVLLGAETMRLRPRVPAGCWLLMGGWSVVLLAATTEVVRGVEAGRVADGVDALAMSVAIALVGTASLSPSSSQPVRPVSGPMERLPFAQVGLLVVGLLLGPFLLAFYADESGTRGVVLVMSAVLSLLVVAHLVRLVQGRDALEHRAHHDELTGLPNRRLFSDRAAVAIAHARRTDGHCAVLFLDLDRFKTVNDSLGHSVGNLLLQEVAKRLRSVTRPEDTVARLGGDEFVVFIPQLENPADATSIAAKILDSFVEPFTMGDHRLFAGASIGIAVFPADGHDADSLLKNADTAMYRAKQRGRKTFCTYEQSMNDHAHERLELESRLHSAIGQGELRLHYQPKVHLPSGQVTGMEALLRWEHPELGLLGPAEFISLAEDSGLIVELGEWALNEACRQNQAWVEAGFGPLVVAVNLSLRQFQQQQIADVVAHALRTSGLAPELLELEVTESLAMQDPEQVRSTLLDLREMGVACSIDDFGTGYSGLSHLTRFPIDKLKIDKSFVATIDTDWEAPIVMAVVALAHGLGLKVVAEGVETQGQLERLRELGCDEMQGYLFSRPLAADHFEQLLMLESVATGPGRLSAVPASFPRLVHAAS